MYANSKGIRLKSEDELRELKNLGLGIVYYGVETGDDQTLEAIRKGANAQRLLDMALEGKVGLRPEWLRAL